MNSEAPVILRDIVISDISAIASKLNNPNVSRFLTSRIPFPYSTVDAAWWVTVACKEGKSRVIEVSDELVGVVGITPGEYENERSAEIGYWLGEAHWGNGYATAALQQMTDAVFEETEIVRLFAPVFSGNQASMRVLEKAGYALEVIQKQAIYKQGQFYDAHVFVKLKY